MNPTFKVTLLSLAVTLSACSVLEGDKVDYRSVTKTQPLDIPPDLTQLSKETRYTVVDGGISATGYRAGLATEPKAVVATTLLGDVRIERSGNLRWLVVNRSADKLWDPLKEFWRESGFTLSMDEKALGIMETEWNENRAKIPMDPIRSVIGRVFDSLYSSSERDKFRTRLERDASGNTEIFITHRGVMETYTSSSKESTAWQARPTDPELEAEFLRRLMVKLGATTEVAKTQVATLTSSKSTSSITRVNNQPTLEIQEGLDRAWRRVGLAIDRTGFTVEDRDRKQGIYYVRFVAPVSTNPNESFFSKIFSGGTKPPIAAKYQIALRSAGDASTTVFVQNEKGEPESSESAQRIVQILADDIK